MASTTATNSFLQRLIGAMALDAAIYEDVEADRTATGQALAVVLLSSVAAGLGARGAGGSAEPSLSGIIFISTLSLVAWVASALLMFEIGGRPLAGPHTPAHVGEAFRRRAGPSPPRAP